MKKVINLKPNDGVLFISDTQFPYHHKDFFKIMRHLKKTLKPRYVILIGDEADNSFMNYHEKDPNGLGAMEEFKQAYDCIQELKKIFPRVDVIESNHGALHKRKAKTGGIPRNFLKDYHDLWNVPRWRWYEEIVLRQAHYPDVVALHNLASSAENNMKARQCSIIQGHYHSNFEITYMTNHYGKMMFGATIGCLINRFSSAFDYARHDKEVQQLGLMFLKNGCPTLIPINVDRKNNWIKT